MTLRVTFVTSSATESRTSACGLSPCRVRPTRPAAPRVVSTSKVTATVLAVAVKPPSRQDGWLEGVPRLWRPADERHLPQVAGLLFPAEIVLVGEPPASYDWSAGLYQKLAAKLSEIEQERHTGGNVLFYLSTQPSQYATIARGS